MIAKAFLDRGVDVNIATFDVIFSPATTYVYFIMVYIIVGNRMSMISSL